MAVKGVCAIKEMYWNPSGAGYNVVLRIISVDDTIQVEDDFQILNVSPTASRATYEAAARDNLINNFGVSIGVGDTVVMVPGVT